MKDDFRSTDCVEDTHALFDHRRTHDELGASVFWTRPDGVLLETLDEFIAYWQTKRDHTQNGIVEVIEE